MSELRLNTDGHIIKLGADNDVTLTHVADTGILLNSTMQLQFNDASQNINAPSATVLDINATDEIELNATAVDLNGTLDVSGTLTQTGVATFSARSVHSSGITIADAGQIGSASDADSIAIASNGVVTFTQAPVFPDGSLAVADLDIDGATDIGAAVVDADLFIIDDGAGGTNRKVTASRLKTYAAFNADAAQVFNESGADVDFRIEADDTTHMFFVDASEDKIGINQPSPLGILHVRGGGADFGGDVSATASVLVLDNSGHGGMTIGSGSAHTCTINFGDSEDSDIGSIVYNNSGNTMAFTTNTAEAMRIDSSSRVCIGHTSGAHTFHVNKDVGGDAVAAIENANDTNPQGLDLQFTAGNPDNNTQYAIHFGVVTAGTKFIVYSDGDVQNHDNSYGATSDQRIKDNIADATSQWDDIKALKVRKFKLKDDIREYGSDKAKYKIGLVAQEAEAVSPNLINECSPGINDIKSDSTFGTLYEDGDEIPDGKAIGEIKEEKAKVKSLKYSILYMKAIKALQEAQTRIETLETKVKALEDA